MMRHLKQIGRAGLLVMILLLITLATTFAADTVEIKATQGVDGTFDRVRHVAVAPAATNNTGVPFPENEAPRTTQDTEPGADIVVVWEDDQDENGYYQIIGRGFSTFGNERFSQRTINTIADRQQKQQDVAMADNGDTVVVWADDADGNGAYQIRGRVLHADGSEKIADFTVNSIADGQQLRPAVAMAGDGDFVVVWEDDADGNDFYQIRARVFNADGTEKVGDFTVNSTADGQQQRPVVAMADDGSFVVAWEDDTDRNDYYQIKARGFNAEGQERFADITVNSEFAGQQLKPDLAMANDGGFVVVWEDDQDENGFYQIYGRGFDSSGNERFADITINTAASGQQLNPRIDMAGNGDFVVVWEDDQDENDYYQILARGFFANGRQRFTDITVNSIYQGQQVQPDVAMADNGDFVVAWQDDADGNGYYQIKARGLAPDGTERFDDITVNSVADGQQYRPAVAMVKTYQARIIDVSVCVYRDVTLAEETHFENVMGFFADAIYEMSNGSQKIGRVLIQHGSICQVPLHHNAFDVYWSEEVWPWANLSGSDPGEYGLQVHMADTYPFEDEFDALDPDNAEGVGYTLAHEYGHYFYGLKDEYVIQDDDNAVPDSVMANQWRARGGDYEWLNFSVAHKFVTPNNQSRLHGASGWTTLARPSSQDPNCIISPTNCRTFYPELAERAPAPGEDPSIELETPEARSHLSITWQNVSRAPEAADQPTAFEASIRFLPDENVAYPDPVVVNTFVEETAFVTDAGVAATVRDPSGATAALTLTDDGRAPDETARDGIYSGYMPYEQGGSYEVTVTFDDNGGQAVYTRLAGEHTPGLNGESYVETFPPVGQTFSTMATAEVIVGGVVADDHGDTLQQATRILDNNASLSGRVDHAGDSDLFHVYEAEAGQRVVRITDTAFGMVPEVSLLDGNGTVLEQFSPATPDQGDYFYTLVDLDTDEDLYIELSHADQEVSDGTYSVSVGDALANEIEFTNSLLLPTIIK